MIKIDGNNNLVRDEENMAVINTDTSGLNRAKLLKRRNGKNSRYKFNF